MCINIAHHILSCSIQLVGLLDAIMQYDVFIPLPRWHLQTGNYSFDPLPDMPADFGPRVPPEGVEGVLVV